MAPMSPANSLGISKPPQDTRVVVAMSGGVDSSVAAALLARDGYDVVGVTLQLYDHGAAIRKKHACCAGQDIHDARRVAERLGIAHYVLDYEERFRKAVIDDFADAYARGETPIPCVRCNERVKFADLVVLAKELGADALATGHYVRRIDAANGPELHVAADASRDIPPAVCPPRRCLGCRARRAGAGTRATSCSRQRPSSSPSCAFPSVGCRRARFALSLPELAWTLPTSRTARTSASPPMAMMPRSCAACVLTRRHQERSSIWKAARSAAIDRKSTRLNSSHVSESRMPSSA